MPERTFIKNREWHVLGVVDDSGWRARCGANLSQSMKASTKLPVNEATCNTCLELVVADEGAGPPDDAEVPD